MLDPLTGIFMTGAGGAGHGAGAKRRGRGGTGALVGAWNGGWMRGGGARGMCRVGKGASGVVVQL